ncbi:hypothetical protein JT359_08490, partial [Candidatus Poribacteria bacterium]|nr:hypothetical protein [Candidatus Poribacteria bacterium]
MKNRIEILTILLMFAVILLLGCSVLGIATDNTATVSYIQADFGPVSAGSRIPFELPPFPDPSFESIIKKYKSEVAANIGHSHLLTEKKSVIANPTLLWNARGVSPVNIPRPAHWDTVTGYDYTNPHKNMVMFLKHNLKYQSRFQSPRGSFSVDGVSNPMHMEYFLGKIFYTTKDQEKRIDHLSHSGIDTSSAEYHRKKWVIL